MSLPVGFIGIGNMGAPMAANLIRHGYALVVDDLDGARRADFAVAHGAVEARTPHDFSAVTALVTMLPDGVAVRSALLERGVGAALSPGAVVVDMSSSAPAGTRSMACELARHGVGLVDAPVSGGVPKAVDGTLTVMLGADDEQAAALAMPIAEAVGERVMRTGRLGTGHAMKALNNVVSAAGFVAAVEALLVGWRLGVDPAVIVDAMNGSSGRNHSTEAALPADVLPRRFRARFSLGLLTKDAAAAVELAETLGIDAPVCARVHNRLAQALAELGAAADYTAAVRSWERSAGEALPTREPRAARRPLP